VRALCDSSVLIAALLSSEDHHEACAAMLNGADTILVQVQVHALNETFATLTVGSLGFQVDADLTARVIRERIVACANFIVLNSEDVTDALAEARAHGVRGGAVYDYMHLVAARKGEADVLYTVNLADFQALRREGDPEIRRS
jgi:predicted nucleic acid-binding protein